MKGFDLRPLVTIPNDKGDLLKAITSEDAGYLGFEEAYFSSVHSKAIKGWTRHKRMQCNFVVPFGDVLFVVYDGTTFETARLSTDHQQRLTVAPGLWVAFKGLSAETSLVLNIANLRHDDEEEEKRPIAAIEFDW